MPSALATRLALVTTDDPARRVMAGEAHWRGGANPPDGARRFGSAMAGVRSVVVHFTEGWPPREKAEEFVDRFIPTPHPAPGTAAFNDWGIGTQFFVAGDMTVARIIDLPRVTFHGEFVNTWALGVETGNLGTVAPPPGNDWRALNGNAAVDAGDIPGAKLWISLKRFREVVVSWWTTPAYAGPAGAPLGAQRRMLFTEGQYRAWALLARYLAEEFGLPRNFPLLPYVLRTHLLAGGTDPGNLRASRFRRIVQADDAFPNIVRALAAYGFVETDFDAGNEAVLQQRLDAAIESGLPAGDTPNPLKRHSKPWRDLFTAFRGIHGHGYCGAITDIVDDHDCPNPLFDWHRFAREVWDWWWYPFDFQGRTQDPETQRRPYQRPDLSTPLVEYYFEALELAYQFAQTHSTRGSHGIFEQKSSPSVFALAERVPVYAAANGELIAARFPGPQDAVSLGFVLVRHEVFHLPDTLVFEMNGTEQPLNPGRIDYNQEPTFVYSLVMHLDRPEGMNADAVTAANPDWLNRLLIRKKECDLGVAFYDGSANHGGLPAAMWASVPPGSRARLPLLDGWRTDKAALDTFLTDLKAGNVALASRGDGSTPVRVILGDFLGTAGCIRRVGGTGTPEFGIAMEVFANAVMPGFTSRVSADGWDAPAAERNLAVFYQSEWAKTPTAQEQQRLTGLGVNPGLVPWWPAVAQWVSLHPTLPATARLNREGYAFHYRPLDFLRWLNGVTWASEWPKYQVTDGGGSAAARPAQPRRRRLE